MADGCQGESGPDGHGVIPETWEYWRLDPGTGRMTLARSARVVARRDDEDSGFVAEIFDAKGHPRGDFEAATAEEVAVHLKQAGYRPAGEREASRERMLKVSLITESYEPPLTPMTE